MLRELKNEARITIALHTKSPLTIRSEQEKLLDPTMLDMQCVRSRYQGKDAVIIPGSSLKGVIRSRYEKIANIFGGQCCNIVQSGNPCNNAKISITDKNGEKKPIGWGEMTNSQKKDYINQKLCPACQLFGSQLIASKIYIADAYPIGECVLGERPVVGINRITGAAQKGMHFDYETVDDGTFQAEITLKNYELYQMALLLYVLKDLDDGYVTLGGASTRGNGRMEVKKLEIILREYRKSVKDWRGAADLQETPLDLAQQIAYDWSHPFFGEMRFPELTLDEVLCAFKKIDIQSKVKRA